MKTLMPWKRLGGVFALRPPYGKRPGIQFNLITYNGENTELKLKRHFQVPDESKPWELRYTSAQLYYQERLVAEINSYSSDWLASKLYIVEDPEDDIKLQFFESINTCLDSFPEPFSTAIQTYMLMETESRSVHSMDGVTLAEASGGVRYTVQRLAGSVIFRSSDTDIALVIPTEIYLEWFHEL